MQDLDPGTASAFLLGELDPDEAAALEEACFLDQRRHEQLRSLEAELIDDFWSGELSPQRQARFEARYRADPRLRLRAQLGAALKSVPRPASSEEARAAVVRPLFRRLAPALAAVAGIALAVGLPSSDQSEPVLVSLVSATTRSRAPAPAASASEANRLELAVDGTVPEAPTVRVRLGGEVVWQGEPDRVTAYSVEVVVPKARLPEGDAQVELWSDHLVAEYPLRVVP